MIVAVCVASGNEHCWQHICSLRIPPTVKEKKKKPAATVTDQGPLGSSTGETLPQVKSLCSVVAVKSLKSLSSCCWEQAEEKSQHHGRWVHKDLFLFKWHEVDMGPTRWKKTFQAELGTLFSNSVLGHLSIISCTEKEDAVKKRGTVNNLQLYWSDVFEVETFYWDITQLHVKTFFLMTWLLRIFIWILKGCTCKPCAILCIDGKIWQLCCNCDTTAVFLINWWKCYTEFIFLSPLADIKLLFFKTKVVFGYPLSIFFIVVNEFCERFSYYGMRGENTYPTSLLYASYCFHWYAVFDDDCDDISR